MISWVLVLFALFASGSLGAIHVYQNEGLYTKGDAISFQGGREGLHKSRRALGYNEPLPRGISNGYSYISFEHLFFRRSNVSAALEEEEAQRHVEILVFELRDTHKIGYEPAPGVLRLCCDEDLVTRGICSNPGKLIVKRDPNEDPMSSPWVSTVTFSGHNIDATPSVSTWSPPKKGMYYLWFLSCERDRVQALEVVGYTEWKNPHGYLPGMMHPYLGLYATLTALHMFLACMWCYWSLQHWRTLSTLQFLLTGVLFWSMLEVSLWYFDYHHFNRHGFRPYGTTVWAAIAGCLRKTVARVLVLLVCMGYGVVRPALDGLGPRVVVIAVAYLFSSLALDLVTYVGAINDLTPATRLILVLPVALLDTLFMTWGLGALTQLLPHLQLKGRTPKLFVYRAVAWCLGLYAASCIGFSGYEFYSRFSDPDNEHWETDWLTVGMWHILFFLALAWICWIWRPSPTSFRLAYHGDDSDDEGGVKHTVPSSVEAEGMGGARAAGRFDAQVICRSAAAAAAAAREASHPISALSGRSGPLDMNSPGVALLTGMLGLPATPVKQDSGSGIRGSGSFAGLANAPGSSLSPRTAAARSTAGGVGPTSSLKRFGATSTAVAPTPQPYASVGGTGNRSAIAAPSAAPSQGTGSKTSTGQASRSSVLVFQDDH